MEFVIDLRVLGGTIGIVHTYFASVHVCAFVTYPIRVLVRFVAWYMQGSQP